MNAFVAASWPPLLPARLTPAAACPWPRLAPPTHRLPQNKMHINDWAAIQTLFDKLNKQMERTQKVCTKLPGCCGARLQVGPLGWLAAPVHLCA